MKLLERKDKPTNPIMQFLRASSLTQKQHEKSKLQARAADARVVQHTEYRVSSRDKTICVTKTKGGCRLTVLQLGNNESQSRDSKESYTGHRIRWSWAWRRCPTNRNQVNRSNFPPQADRQMLQTIGKSGFDVARLLDPLNESAPATEISSSFICWIVSISQSS